MHPLAQISKLSGSCMHKIFEVDIVRPILEYNSVIWSPYTKKYTKKIEKIQMKICKLIQNFQDGSYQQKLKKPNFYHSMHEGFSINL